jgi:hypothetical protein
MERVNVVRAGAPIVAGASECTKACAWPMGLRADVRLLPDD